MDSEPRFLDIEDELYPDILILKQIVFENIAVNDFTEYFTQLCYNSFKRQIDLKPILLKYFIQNASKFQIPPSNDYNYEVLIKEKGSDKFYLLGVFPHDDSYILGENFLSEEIFYLIIRAENYKNQSSQNLAQYIESHLSLQNSGNFQEPQINFTNIEEEEEKQEDYQEDQNQQQLTESNKTKSSGTNKRKTIEEILKIVAEWRKLITVKKMSVTEASQIMKMSKRSLEDYYNTIKLAEKYGFDFDNKIKNGFAELRNFVKEHHETKTMPKVQILEKFKNMKK